MDFKRLDELAAQVKAMRPLNQAELKRLRDEFVVENTYDSNAIEGNSLTLRETALILQEGITIAEKPLKDHLEAIGHRDAFEYVVSLAGEKKPLTERVIKEIHSLVLMNDRENRVQLLIDRSVQEKEEFCCHPCINTSTLKLKTADLLEVFLPAVNHTPIYVDLPEDAV